ncbi:hypothetical protein OAG56_01275 [Mariniblastus sp.]|nr:hypothetical protein [Mariniblastus sp.]MDB4755974.1 hypothetical protein [Mariniblastus sp.]
MARKSAWEQRILKSAFWGKRSDMGSGQATSIQAAEKRDLLAGTDTDYQTNNDRCVALVGALASPASISASGCPLVVC